MTLPPYLQHHAEGLILSVVAAPRAKRSRIMGLHDGSLRIALAAPPIDGRANEALVAFVAELVGLPKRDVQLTRGDTSKRKNLLLRTSQRTTLAATIATAVLDAEGPKRG